MPQYRKPRREHIHQMSPMQVAELPKYLPTKKGRSRQHGRTQQLPSIRQTCDTIIWVVKCRLNRHIHASNFKDAVYQLSRRMKKFTVEQIRPAFGKLLKAGVFTEHEFGYRLIIH